MISDEDWHPAQGGKMVGGNVISMPERNKGNGAREVIAKFCRNDETGAPDFDRGDKLLMWLWGEGFKVVPVE